MRSLFQYPYCWVMVSKFQFKVSVGKTCGWNEAGVWTQMWTVVSETFHVIPLDNCYDIKIWRYRGENSKVGPFLYFEWHNFIHFQNDYFAGSGLPITRACPSVVCRVGRYKVRLILGIYKIWFLPFLFFIIFLNFSVCFTPVRLWFN